MAWRIRPPRPINVYKNESYNFVTLLARPVLTWAPAAIAKPNAPAHLPHRGCKE